MWDDSQEALDERADAGMKDYKARGVEVVTAPADEIFWQAACQGSSSLTKYIWGCGAKALLSPEDVETSRAFVRDLMKTIEFVVVTPQVYLPLFVLVMFAGSAGSKEGEAGRNSRYMQALRKAALKYSMRLAMLCFDGIGKEGLYMRQSLLRHIRLPVAARARSEDSHLGNVDMRHQAKPLRAQQLPVQAHALGADG